MRIKSGRGRGGTVENIRFDNWIIEDPAGAAIEVTNYYTKVPDEPVSARTPIFRNIAITRMTVNRAPVAVSIEGLPEMPITALRLMDIIATAKAGLRAFNTKGLELHNMLINPVAGPAFLIRKSTGLELDQVKSDAAGAAPTIRLDDCPDAMIRASRGTLSASPGAKLVSDLKLQESDTNFWKNIKTPE